MGHVDVLVGWTSRAGRETVAWTFVSMNGDVYVPIETPFTCPTERPATVAPAITTPTIRPTPAPVPTATPAPSPKPSPLPGIGKRVPAGNGWAVTVTRVERWRPSWYDEPGWRLLTAYVKVRMPAVDDGCGWGDSFWLQAKCGRTYQGWLDQVVREPELFACADYHRATTVAGWVTFEVRGADAKGLILHACLPAYGWCETPAIVRLS